MERHNTDGNTVGGMDQTIAEEELDDRRNVYDDPREDGDYFPFGADELVYVLVVFLFSGLCIFDILYIEKRNK